MAVSELLFLQVLLPRQFARVSHRVNKEWRVKENHEAFNAENWPSGSPDLNPLDCKPWTPSKDMSYRKHHNNLESLKRSNVKAAAEIPLEMVRAVTAECPERLKACVEVERGNF